MKNPYELLRAKEQEIVILKRQIEALRLAAPLLGDEDEEEILAERAKSDRGLRMS